MIDFDLYVNQPEVYEEKSVDGVKLVCKLNKSLYGLKQSGRNWNNLLDSFLKDFGFKQSLSDPCLYTKFSNESVIICLVWVDDLLICSDDENCLTKFKGTLSKRFKMKDLGVLE